LLDKISATEAMCGSVATRTAWPQAAGLCAAITVTFKFHATFIAQHASKQADREVERRTKLIHLLVGWLLYMDGAVLRDREVSRRFRLYQAGGWKRLHEDMTTRKRVPRDSTIHDKYRKVMQLVRQGNLSKANELLQSSASVLQVDKTNVQQVLHKFKVVPAGADLQLHPPESDLAPDDGNPEERERFTACVKEAILKGKNGKAGGCRVGGTSISKVW
jgi:hypothetical protein